MSEAGVDVWCLLGRKAGDNTQVRALADELGYGYQEKRVRARPWELLTHLGRRPTLAGIDSASAAAIVPPWPDLVISAGRRNEQVAQWIKQQSAGNTALVHMGRPWAPLDAWDLIVTTPQYFLPQRDNILHNSLPLHRLTRADLLAAGESLRPRIEALPRPWIAVLVGGDSGRFVLTAAKGARLGELASQLAAACGGSLLLSDNPYRGLLALADAFVVTGESMSMLGEAAAMGRPLYIFDVGDGDTPWWQLLHNYRYKPLSHRFAMCWGPVRMRRDIGNIQQQMVSSGIASWLDSDGIAVASDKICAPYTDAAVTGSSAQEELRRTATAVRRLVTAR